MANAAHCKTAIIPEKLEVWQMLLIVKLQLFQKN